MARNAISREGEDAFNSPYIYAKIAEYRAKFGEGMPDIRKPIGYLWKRESGQVAVKSLGWIHCENSLIWNNSILKGKGCLKDREIIIGKDGSLKTVGEYEQISLGQSSYHLGKLSYFLKFLKLGKSSIARRTSVTERLTRSGAICHTEKTTLRQC